MTEDARPDHPLRFWGQIALAVAGVAGVLWLSVHIGIAELKRAASSLAPWLPLMVALEALRIGADAAVTRLLYGEHGVRVPVGALLKAHLMAYPAVLLLPAGRAVGEGIKAALLRRFVPITHVAAAAVVAPALALGAVFIVSLPVLAAAAAHWGGASFTWAIALQAATAIAAALGLSFVARRPALGRLVERMSSRLGATTERVQSRVRDIGWIPRAPLAAAVANRALLAAQVFVLAAATGVRGDVLRMAAVGVHLVGLAVGDAVPGQLGATDASFGLAGEALGVSLASAVAVALTLHAVQLLWALIGALAALAWPTQLTNQ